jgi:hypothetical protein
MQRLHPDLSPADNPFIRLSQELIYEVSFVTSPRARDIEPTFSDLLEAGPSTRITPPPLATTSIRNMGIAGGVITPTPSAGSVMSWDSDDLLPEFNREAIKDTAIDMELENQSVDTTDKRGRPKTPNMSGSDSDIDWNEEI